MQSQLMSYERASADRRLKILDGINARIQKREETFQTGQQKWNTNQVDKKNRKTRDLHFELALGAKRTMNIRNNNQRHQLDQENGIDNFEMNLKRNGIGGDVDEGGTLLPSAEDSGIFMNRLELNATKDWPSDGEVGDFMQVLEKRTKELRVARAEKARRKRRMLVDQDAALGEMEDTDNMDEEDVEFSTASALELKATLKQQNYDERTIGAKEKHSKRVEEAENKMRIFCEQARMREFDEDVRHEKFNSTLTAQKQRLQDKKERNHEMCKTLVQQLINELFATGANAQELQTKTEGPKYEEDIAKPQLITALLDLALQPPPQDVDSHPLSKRAISSKASDLWISAVNLANNAGKWARLTAESPHQFGMCTSDYGRVSSFSESAVKILSELISHLQNDNICPFEIDAMEPFERYNEFKHNAEDKASKDAAEAAEEGVELVPHVTPPRPQQVCMVLGEMHDISESSWSLCLKWMGGEQNVSLWCVDKCLKFAFDLYAAAIPEGKDVPNDDLISFSVLSSMFGVTGEQLAQNNNDLDVDGATAALAGVAMLYQTTSTIAEIITTVSRIKESKSLLPDDNSVPDTSEVDISAFEFNNFTLIILSAQILWLRDYVSREIFHATNVRPYSPHVLFFSSRGKSPDQWLAVKLFDWFTRGGSRLAIPDDEPLLSRIVKAEMATEKPKKGKGGGPKKRDKKDKSEPVFHKNSTIRSVVWVHTPPIPIVDEAKTDLEGEETGVDQIVDVEEKDGNNELDKDVDENVEQNPVVDLYDEFLPLHSKIISLFHGVWRAKWNNFTDEEKSLTSLQDGLREFSVATSCPVHFFTLGDGVVDPSCSSFSIFNDFCVVEYMISIFLVDILGEGANTESSGVEDLHVSPSMQSGDEDEEEVEPQQSPSLPSHLRVVELIEKRKSLLGLAEKMWRAITMKELSLDITDVNRILLDSRRQAMAYDEHLGSMVLAALVKLEGVRNEISFEKAKAIHCMKSVDHGWKDTCLKYREGMQKIAQSHSKSSNGEIKAVFSSSVRELNCELGDIIDARHLEWLKLVKVQENVFSEILNEMIATTLDISYCFRESFSNLLKKNIETSLAIAAVVFDKNGESPWALKTALAPSDVLEQLRAAIIEQVESLHNHILDIGQTSLKSDFLVEKWTELFADIDSCVSQTVAASDNAEVAVRICSEVRYEAYMSFTCLVKSFTSAIESLKMSKNNLVEDLNCYVKGRNSYEHDMLKSWIAELYQTRQNKNNTHPMNAPIEFISTYFFGVSDDPELDGVPHTSFLNPGLVDVEDMRMDAKTLRSLAYYIVKVRQECEFQNLSVFDTLKAIATKAIESDESFPQAWRSLKRLKALYESVLASSMNYSLSESHDLFFQHLVMKLALGFLEFAPSSAYVVKLGLKIFTNTEDLSKSIFLCSAEDQIVDLSRISDSIKRDKVLKLGWWNSTDIKKPSLLAAHTATVVDVVESIALMCCTSVTPISFGAADKSIETAYVRFDTLAVLLTKNFTAVHNELKVFQKYLCSSYFEKVIDDPPQKKTLKKVIFPNFVDEGLTKLTNVAVALVEADDSSHEVDVLSELEKNIYGPTLSISKKKWIEKQLELPDDTIGPDDGLNAGALFRKTQKKPNFSFMV
jgi:hypothetical protein